MNLLGAPRVRVARLGHYFRMEPVMTVRIPLPTLAALLTVLAFLLGPVTASAQTAGPEEAVRAGGVVRQQLALTPAQKSAIYTAVRQQRARSVTTVISAAVGTPVASAVALSELPDQATAGNPWAAFLKYAMVEDDVVVVDPINMRVVDIIHGSARP
jgi:hypothetical protein